MWDKKVIIFDLDGTAVDSPRQKLPSQRLKRAVKRLQSSHRLCVATGRPWSYARPIIEALELSEPCIVSAGTQIYHPVSGRILWQNNLPDNALRDVIRTLKNHKPLRETNCKVLFDDFDEHQHFNGGLAVEELEAPGQAYFVAAMFVPDGVAYGVQAELSAITGINCTLTVAQAPGCKDVHITSSGASKEHAVARLLQIMGLEASDAVGIGDGHNDLHLFNAVSHRVAMDNAVDELKMRAHHTIGHVREDGLAHYFESLWRLGASQSRQPDREKVCC